MNITFEEVINAYYDCRKGKTNSEQHLDFFVNLEQNLYELFKELQNNTYEIGESIIFIVKRPKPREIWAGHFRDRIVHHILYNRLYPHFHKRFSADSCACIPNRGTHYGVNRLISHTRKITNNYTNKTYYLKADIRNFFSSINKDILFNLTKKQIQKYMKEDKNYIEYTIKLLKQITYHNPTKQYISQATEKEYKLIIKEKSLFYTIIFNNGLPMNHSEGN